MKSHRKLGRAVTGAALLVLPLHARASATPECQVRILQAVTDDLGNHWSPDKLLPVTIERRGPQGSLLCASGGSCIPEVVNGKKAVQMMDCKVGPAITKTDRRLVPDAHLAGAAKARAMRLRDDTDEKLSALGFSNAAAGTLADAYVSRPNSATGRLVAGALAGSSEALGTLKRRFP